MKKIALATLSFVAMTGFAMADPSSSTEMLMGSASSNAVTLSDNQMTEITGGQALLEISPLVNVNISTNTSLALNAATVGTATATSTATQNIRQTAVRH